MPDYFSHSTAVIDHGAHIGAGCKVWHFSHVCSGAKIGKNVTIGQGVFIGNGAVIGNNCKIQNNVSIFDGVVLEDDVFCGPSMVFTNVINPRAFVNRKQEFLSTTVCKGATLGANSTVICGATVGQYSFVAAGAVVTKDVKAFSLMVGVPATQRGWMSRFGERLKFSDIDNSCQVCPFTGDIYTLENSRVTLQKG